MSARRRSAASTDQGPPRVVIDTNVVLSALVFGKGTTARLRAAWQGGHCLPLVSTATAQELVRVLAYPKFRLDPQEQQELLADYLHDPKGTIPGNRMSYAGVKDDAELADLLAYLRTLADSPAPLPAVPAAAPAKPAEEKK